MRLAVCVAVALVFVVSPAEAGKVGQNAHRITQNAAAPLVELLSPPGRETSFEITRCWKEDDRGFCRFRAVGRLECRGVMQVKRLHQTRNYWYWADRLRCG